MTVQTQEGCSIERYSRKDQKQVNNDFKFFISFVVLCYVAFGHFFHLEFDLERTELINIYHCVVFMRWKGYKHVT